MLLGPGLLAAWPGTAVGAAQSRLAAKAEYTGKPGALTAVAALSAGNAWAVGDYGTSTRSYTLILHWNGKAWSRVASPDIGALDYLTGVSGDSPSDLWAVGWYFATETSVKASALLLHWNGRAWSAASVSRAQPIGYYPKGISVHSATDAWAVGDSCATCTLFTLPGELRALILHWNGKSWLQVASPGTGSGPSYLDGIDATGASTAWSVGGYFTGAPPAAAEHPLILRWNGNSWSKYSPPAGLGLGAVAGSSSNAWAVGSGSQGPVAYHYQNSKWAQVPIAGGVAGSDLNAVAEDSATDTWATGVGYAGHHYTNLAEHWNGRTWKAVAPPELGSSSNTLSGVAIGSAKSVWAVGNYEGSSGSVQVLLLHWNGASWSAQ
jgi:hypothetical protein